MLRALNSRGSRLNVSEFNDSPAGRRLNAGVYYPYVQGSGISESPEILLMKRNLHYLKDPKLLDLWYIPYYG